MQTRWILGDVETTGTDDEAGVCEIAWIEANDQLEVLAEVSSLINPGHPIPPEASAVHHITNAHVADAPSLEGFMRQSGYPLEHGQVVLIAHNAAFDQRFFRPYCGDDMETMCTLRLARHLYPGLPSHKLQALRYRFDLEGGEAHRAAGDIVPMLGLVRRMMLEFGLTLEELVMLSKEPIEVTHWPLGKHRGKPLNHDMGYVRWALKNMNNMDDDLRAALEAL